MDEKAWSGCLDQRYATQLGEGFPWLRFSGDLEREYRNSYIELNAMRIRLAAVIGLIGIFGFLFVDEVIGAKLQPVFADWLLVLVTVPGILIPLAATFSPRASPYVLYILTGGVTLTAASVLVAVYLGRAANAWFPYEALYLLIMFIYFVSGLMFYQAIAVAVSVTVGFIVTNLPTRGQPLLYEGYYLLLANAIGILGHYMLERQSRMAFLMRAELRQQAILDSLTGLMNRRAFDAHLESAWRQALREQCSIGLMLVDLDHFKRVNDSGGHPFGDNALQHVAQVLRSCAMRPMDAAARYGGDEFIGMWYEVDGAWLAKLAEELPGRFGGLICDDAKAPVQVTVSGGAVLAWPRPGVSQGDAIRAVDDLMYETKRSARGTVGYRTLPPPSQAQGKTAA